MRTFYLYRRQDISGVSGTGFIAQGVVFPTGRVVMEWAVPPHSIGFHDSLDALLQVHGHGGNTVIVWEEDKEQFGRRDKAV